MKTLIIGALAAAAAGFVPSIATAADLDYEHETVINRASACRRTRAHHRTSLLRAPLRGRCLRRGAVSQALFRCVPLRGGAAIPSLASAVPG